MEIEKAMHVLTNAMKNDPDYAHSWHCNIAMTCYDAIRDSDKNQLGHETAHEIGNDAASRFMAMCFDVETSAKGG